MGPARQYSPITPDARRGLARNLATLIDDSLMRFRSTRWQLTAGAIGIAFVGLGSWSGIGYLRRAEPLIASAELAVAALALVGVIILASRLIRGRG